MSRDKVPVGNMGEGLMRESLLTRWWTPVSQKPQSDPKNLDLDLDHEPFLSS